jgi:VWFA-related protein
VVRVNSQNACTTALLIAACAHAWAQEPTFKTQAPLVVVPVTVSTKTGERLWGLTDGDFTLLDNGRERKVTVEPWGTYESYTALVVVIQTSSMSHAALLKVKKTAGMLDSITGEGGEVAVITADSEVETRLAFTSRWEPIQETFEKLTATGTGAGRVLDGVDAAIALLSQKPRDQRRLVLVLSEARDRGSKVKATEVLTHAQQQNVAIYTASYSAYATPFTTKATDDQAGPVVGTNLLQVFVEIAQATKQNMSKTLPAYTGGRQLGFNTLHRLEEDLAEIGKEVHSQYQLSFVPESEKDPVYPELTVKVINHPDALIRARPGYWSGPPPVSGSPR